MRATQTFVLNASFVRGILVLAKLSLLSFALSIKCLSSICIFVRRYVSATDVKVRFQNRKGPVCFPRQVQGLDWTQTSGVPPWWEISSLLQSSAVTVGRW